MIFTIFYRQMSKDQNNFITVGMQIKCGRKSANYEPLLFRLQRYPYWPFR